MKQNGLFIAIVVVLIIFAGLFFYIRQADMQNERVDAMMEEVSDGQTEDSSEPAVQGTYAVSVEETVVNWEGRKPLLVDYKEAGTLKVSEGSVEVAEDGAVSGSFSFDMESIDTPTTMGNKPPAMLIGHLKSEDFFNVEEFPTAEFEIREVARAEDVETSHAYTVTGDLTIKGITNEITFPALIYMEDGALVAEASTQFDRTLWDIRYGSNNFFDNVGNNLIDDLITIAFKLVAHSE